jgi:homoserine O-acetyltransferase
MAYDPAAAPERRLAMDDLPLEGGGAIRDFTLTYVTHGELNAAKDNAILVLPPLTGHCHRADYLIGAGLALDPARDFIISSDTIGNGRSTSPSNSRIQPRMAFPRFGLRDMVVAQHRLVTHLGLRRLKAVMGISMGGMQSLQWAVSHPEMMDKVVAIVALTRTPPWSQALIEASRKAIMNDPAWNGGDYPAPPERGARAWADLMRTIIYTPAWFRHSFRTLEETLAFQREQETFLITEFDVNDYILQSHAYERHDIGATPGVGGYEAALRAIRARTLLLVAQGDLLNPEQEVIEAARIIPDARCLTIPSMLGHRAGSGVTPEDAAFLNRVIGEFLRE